MQGSRVGLQTQDTDPASNEHGLVGRALTSVGALFFYKV